MRVERLLHEFGVDFDVCAFDLKPGIPPEGLPRQQVYAGRTYPSGYLDNMRQMAADSGIEMKRPPLIPNTRKPHEATEFARDNGRLLEFHCAVFKAYWADEENIGDPAVLCRIAADCGMNGGALEAALGDGRYAGRIEEQMAWSRDVGITGVPTVIFDGRIAVVGAQDYETFRDVARRVFESRSQA